MSNAETTRRGFVKGAVMGAAAAGLGIMGAASANTAHATEGAYSLSDASAARGEAKAESTLDQDELPDTYTHATPANYKQILEGEAYDNALRFLKDSSHYLYVDRANPSHGNFHTWPETGFDTDWRSPVNGRPYRGPFYDPLNRSVIWLTANPNGAISASVGSYWAVLPPNTELELNYNELQGYEPSDDWQVVCYMINGETVDNFIRTGRGTLMIDAALATHYGLDESWGFSTPEPTMWQDRNVLAVEVKLRSYTPRVVTPQQYYDGCLPSTTSMNVPLMWSALPGWGEDAGDDQFRTIAQFWGCAEGSEAELNLNTDEERNAYIERANADEDLCKALTGMTVDLYFDIMQIVEIKQEIGFDFEQGNGKVNGIDMDGDGMLDRWPEDDKEHPGELILKNSYRSDTYLLPDWAYELNFNLDWWVTPDGSGLINSEGKKIVGANPDGTYILEDEQ